MYNNDSKTSILFVDYFATKTDQRWHIIVCSICINILTNQFVDVSQYC